MNIGTEFFKVTVFEKSCTLLAGGFDDLLEMILHLDLEIDT